MPIYTLTANSSTYATYAPMTQQLPMCLTKLCIAQNAVVSKHLRQLQALLQKDTSLDHLNFASSAYLPRLPCTLFPCNDQEDDGPMAKKMYTRRGVNDRMNNV